MGLTCKQEVLIWVTLTVSVAVVDIILKEAAVGVGLVADVVVAHVVAEADHVAVAVIKSLVVPKAAVAIMPKTF